MLKYPEMVRQTYITKTLFKVGWADAPAVSMAKEQRHDSQSGKFSLSFSCFSSARCACSKPAEVLSRETELQETNGPATILINCGGSSGIDIRETG